MKPPRALLTPADERRAAAPRASAVDIAAASLKCPSHHRAADSLAALAARHLVRVDPASGPAASAVGVRRFVEHVAPSRFAPGVVVIAAAFLERLARDAAPRGGLRAALPPALAEPDDGWQLCVLALLMLAGKSYTDVPETPASLLCEGSPIRAGWPFASVAALNSAEIALLGLLEWCTVCSPVEFAAASRHPLPRGC